MTSQASSQPCARIASSGKTTYKKPTSPRIICAASSELISSSRHESTSAAGGRDQRCARQCGRDDPLDPGL